MRLPCREYAEGIKSSISSFRDRCRPEIDPVERLRNALGQRLVGIWEGMKPHTYWSEVVEIIDDARPLDSDTIITVGAGSSNRRCKKWSREH